MDRFPSPHRDDGRISVFLAIAFLASIVLTGLAVDGGGQLRALSRANNLAAEAARAAGQAIDIPEAISGHDTLVDAQRARLAAEAYLAAADVTGQATIADDRRGVTVTVTIAYDTRMLGVIGISQTTVTGRATARLVTG
ncbi:MAG: hypothetical protein HKP61_21700 [Dactylosporangium sp.]|nr:hypothetical protein [Dactylosporangium sp.]NNJ63497.1 hypothetical protein [Dactylosporangium sp.]